MNILAIDTSSIYASCAVMRDGEVLSEKVSLSGLVHSKWSKQENYWRYEITTPVETEIVIGKQKYQVKAGTHLFFAEREAKS